MRPVDDWTRSTDENWNRLEVSQGFVAALASVALCDEMKRDFSRLRGAGRFTALSFVVTSFVAGRWQEYIV